MDRADIVLRASLLMFLSGVCQVQTAGGCGQFVSCERCLTSNASLNLADCAWAQCRSDDALCVSKSSGNLTGCSVFDVPSMCAALHLTTVDRVPVSNTTLTTTTSTAATVTTTAKEMPSTTAGSTTPVPTTGPVYSPTTFDPASFIGGILLVLGAEALVFFALKYFRTREGTYQTLI
ncbi:sialomucin core protein 24 [Callorhinchus milii]|uniref:sialomucin core protein 24 n=1 Tax=Callorhinchus milii TaxID=7868 RepID=UPI00045758A9|nr:sialomucin core protein 24 [Callorhinchus milii]|eukprot:gi/632954400/ref/XP_007892944.1/ PREDICTED: CD164 sialomucin-like 2 protein [Callorhinchus milii]